MKIMMMGVVVTVMMKVAGMNIVAWSGVKAAAEMATSIVPDVTRIVATVMPAHVARATIVAGMSPKAAGAMASSVAVAVTTATSAVAATVTPAMSSTVGHREGAEHGNDRKKPTPE